MLGCLLYAVSGGDGNTSARYLFLFTIERQCLACILLIDGSLGSYVITKTGLFLVDFGLISLRAISLGTLYSV